MVKLKKESIKKSDKKDTLKKKLLKALEKSLGIVTTACKQVKCSRNTFYQYCNDDQGFKKSVDDISNICLDFVESQLFKLIENEHPTAIIFYLKTKGKQRGYVEKQEIQIDTIEKTPQEMTDAELNAAIQECSKQGQL